MARPQRLAALKLVAEWWKKDKEAESKNRGGLAGMMSKMAGARIRRGG